MNIMGFSVQSLWLITIQPGRATALGWCSTGPLCPHSSLENRDQGLGSTPKGPRDTSKLIPPLRAQVSSSCHSSMWDITQFLRFVGFIFNGHHEI